MDKKGLSTEHGDLHFSNTVRPAFIAGMSSIEELVTTIGSSIGALSELLAGIAETATATSHADPTGALTEEHLNAAIAVEKAFNQKALFDGAFAQVVQESSAGNLVGSTRPAAFLSEHLDISNSEALARLRRGRRDFAELDDPTDTQATSDRAYGRKAFFENSISADKQNMLERELKKLHKPEIIPGMRVKAIGEASIRSVEDLRSWVRNEVADLNGSSMDRDPHAGARKRHVVIGKPDADGGCFIRGYFPAATSALLEAALAPARNPGYASSVEPEDDTRGLQQRRADAFHQILLRHAEVQTERNGGVGTIAISMSIKDIDDMTHTSRFPTNTHVQLSPMDILTLGAAKFDFLIVHDPHSGRPLHLGRTQRTASIEQRIALMAAEGVCIHHRCEQSAINCEVHHVLPWARGGHTDIENLHIYCRTHHRPNNDSPHDSPTRGRSELDPETGRYGYRPPKNFYNPDPQIELNNSAAQYRSAGAKIRRQ